MNTVIIDRNDKVWTITIDRPHARNAVDGATARALVDAFKAFDADADACVAILTGADGQFCAGADLNMIRRTAEFDGATNLEDARRGAKMLFTLATLSKPWDTTIAATQPTAAQFAAN